VFGSPSAHGKLLLADAGMAFVISRGSLFPKLREPFYTEPVYTCAGRVFRSVDEAQEARGFGPNGTFPGDR
jgi:hypothetical protein